MADYTASYGIYKPGVHWVDENPGQGAAEMVSQALDNLDAALSGGGRLGTKSVAISSAQLLNMKAAPVEIIAAMSGFAALPLSAAIQYIPVSVDYVLGDATFLYIGSAVNPITVTNALAPISASVLDGTNGPGNVIGLFPSLNVLLTAQSWFDNQALVLTHDGSAELTTGDGTAVVTLAYLLITL